jgi:hypothetical protein
MLGIRVPSLIRIPHVELRHAAGLLELHHRGSPSLLPHHARWINVVDVRVQPPLTASGALRGLDGEKVEASSMPCIISGMGFKLPLRFSSIV